MDGDGLDPDAVHVEASDEFYELRAVAAPGVKYDVSRVHVSCSVVEE
jgi:hypothetical protein